MSAVITRAVAAAAVVLVATACSGGTTSGSATAAPGAASTTASAAATTTAAASSPTAAAATAAGASDPTADRAAVEKTFNDYDKALLARDFTTACSLTSSEAANQLIKAIKAQGGQADSCEQAFGAVYAVPEASRTLDEAARSATVQKVVVSGDIATVTYSGEAGGQRREGLTNKMQRVDGRWRLLGNGA